MSNSFPILVSLYSLFASSSASLVYLASSLIFVSLCSCSLSLCIISEADLGRGGWASVLYEGRSIIACQLWQAMIDLLSHPPHMDYNLSGSVPESSASILGLVRSVILVSLYSLSASSSASLLYLAISCCFNSPCLYLSSRSTATAGQCMTMVSVCTCIKYIITFLKYDYIHTATYTHIHTFLRK